MLRRQEEPEEASGGSEWMNTYADLVTLLFAFFVLLFAISQVDVQKFNMLVVALSDKGASPEAIVEVAEKYDIQGNQNYDINDPRIAIGDSAENQLGSASGDNEVASKMQEVYNSLDDYIRQSELTDQVELSLGEDYVFIRFMDEILFDGNSAVIRPENFEILEVIGNGLRVIEDDIEMIRIDGHTASIPENENYPVSDRELSSKRANAVLTYFEDSVGIRSDKLAAYALGKHRPVADNNTEEGRARNRRIEILVSSSDVIDNQLDNIYESLVN